MPQCPRCSDGKIYGVCPPIMLDCPTCEGTNKITDEQLLWIEQGKKIRELRRNKLVGPSDAAEKLGIKPSVLLSMENGRVKPDETLFHRILEIV